MLVMILFDSIYVCKKITRPRAILGFTGCLYNAPLAVFFTGRQNFYTPIKYINKTGRTLYIGCCRTDLNTASKRNGIFVFKYVDTYKNTPLPPPPQPTYINIVNYYELGYSTHPIVSGVYVYLM